MPEILCTLFFQLKCFSLALHSSGLSVNLATLVMNGALMAGTLPLPGGAGGSMEPPSNRPELQVSHGEIPPFLLTQSSDHPGVGVKSKLSVS